MPIYERLFPAASIRCVPRLELGEPAIPAQIMKELAWMARLEEGIQAAALEMDKWSLKVKEKEMAEGDFVEPLTGEEIVIDLCTQIAEKLRRDCNLRETDSYQGGYSAKVSIHLEAYGMDTATVETEVVSGKTQEDPDEVIHVSLDVPVEAALDQVRERSDQPVPTLSNEGGQPVVRPRRYVRRERVVGGATGEELP